MINHIAQSALKCYTINGNQIRAVTTSAIMCKFASPEDVPVPPKEEVNTRQKLSTWQKVQPKGRGIDKAIEYMQKDESFVSNSKKARDIAESKLQSLEDTLRSKGWVRMTKYLCAAI